MNVLERKIRFIDSGAAMEDLNIKGISNPKFAAVVEGGLTGQADVSRLVIVGDIVYEFESKGASVTVYKYTYAEVKDNPRFIAYYLGVLSDR